ncbi:BQ2448_410 [Microbotryum intermedium]|uniref:Golgi apparatus membrane protein TVP38 n=1 Tax=Microbotryum intermedium TaxID=269621 RepID=A0A238F6A5_9BASI|nr:BQ2448_410 [Microbotryum intermedium]
MLRALQQRARETLDRARDSYDSLSSTSKLMFWFWVALHFVTIALVIYITPAQLFAWMADWAANLRDMGPSGRLVLLGLIVLTSFPPLFGYGTTITLCGFAFGTFQGWILAALGCVLGGCLSFIVTRKMIGTFAPMLAREPTFVALGRAVRVKGLGLCILIRLCPFPFPYSNAFFATIETVTLFQFFLSTLCITPKLLLHVWIGSRMFLFADPDSRNHMDPRAKFVNLVFVVLGSVLGMLTSWYLYRLTMRYVDVAGNGRGVELEDEEVILGRGHDDDEEDEDEDDGEEEEEEDHRPRSRGLLRDVDRFLADQDLEQEANASMPLKERSTNHMGGPQRTSIERPKHARNGSLKRGNAAAQDDWGETMSDFGDDQRGRRTSMGGAASEGDEADLWGLNGGEEEQEGQGVEEQGLKTIEEGDSSMEGQTHPLR